jgi:hypothetical protein
MTKMEEPNSRPVYMWLRDDTFSSCVYIASNEWMAVGCTWKEVAVAYFKLTSQRLTGMTE